MGVISDGTYDIPEGLIFSVPLQIGADKNWTVVKGLEINDFARSMLEITIKVSLYVALSDVNWCMYVQN